MSDNTEQIIAGNFEPISFLKHDYLLKEGNICNEYLFLENGFMRSYAFDTEGNEVTTQNASVKHIASYLGVTDTSLSRIRKEIAFK